MADRNVNAEIMLEIRLNQVDSSETSRKVYDNVYSEVALWQSDSFYAWIHDQLQLGTGESYLDISCGRGELVKLAEKQDVNAYGLDLSHRALRLGRQQHGASNLVTANAQSLPYAANTFDLVSNIGSLEHYMDMKRAIQEMSRVLKPEGRAVVLVPNTFSLMVNVWTAFRQGRTSIDPYQPIQRYGARREWQQLLEDNGLAVVQTKKYERVHPRSWSDLRALLGRPKELLRTLLAPFVPLNLSFCFVFICANGRQKGQP